MVEALDYLASTGCRDVALLERWIERAAVTESGDEVFE